MSKNPIENGNTKTRKLLSVLKVVGAAVLIVSIWILCQVLQKPITSLDDFRTGMEARGFVVRGYGTGAKFDSQQAVRGEMVLDYHFADSRQSAQHAAELEISLCEDEYGARAYSYSETGKSLRVYLKNSDTFFIVHQYEYMLFYATGDIDDAPVLKAINKELTPGNALVAFALILMGVAFSGLSAAFLAQEAGKQRNCTVPAVATVLRNVQKRTRNKRNSYTFSYSPVLAFYADGAEQEVVYSNGFPSPMPEGEQVEIFYKDGEPEIFRFADARKERIFKILAVAFILVGFVFLAWGYTELR